MKRGSNNNNNPFYFHSLAHSLSLILSLSFFLSFSLSLCLSSIVFFTFSDIGDRRNQDILEVEFLKENFHFVHRTHVHILGRTNETN